MRHGPLSPARCCPGPAVTWTPDQPERRQAPRRRIDDVAEELALIAGRMETIRAEAEADRVRIRADMHEGLTSVRVSRGEKALGLLMVFLIVGSIGTLTVTLGYESRKNLVKSERNLCATLIQDRWGSIRARVAQIRSAAAVANDPSRSAATRRAARTEARVLRVSTDDLRTRVDVKHGGDLDCARAFPLPGVFR